MSTPGVREVSPQEGFQTAVMTCSADIAVIGGSAGCGKTWCLLLEPVRNLEVNGFNGIVFRRESVQITAPGGLWDKSLDLYNNMPFPYIPKIKQKPATFSFPLGSVIQLNHLNQTLDVLGYQGADICYIAFDELTHFERYQFFYMLSRNRSTCGVKPYIRASTNPQGEGWVKDLISWWIYPDNHPNPELRGAPIPERRGVLRYLVVINNESIWGATQEECWNNIPSRERAKIAKENIKSFTFIGGLLSENQALLKVDPGYVGNLMAQEENDRVQLMDGRWINVHHDADRLYKDDEIHDIFTNSFVIGNGSRYMTADVALLGADFFTIGIWDDWVLEKIYRIPKVEPEEVQPLLEGIAKENRIPQSHIAFDANGVGALIKGFLKYAFPFMGSENPMADSEDMGAHKEAKKKPNYLNLRAQVYWKFKQVLSDRRMYVAVKDIDLRDKIIQELKAIKIADLTGEKKLQIISNDDIKTAIKRSPDLAVMIVMRCVFSLIRPPVKTFRRKVR